MTRQPRHKNLDISVVIPARNEAELLPITLDSLRAQKYNGNFEVIVTDNGSTDDTAKIAQHFGARVVVEPKQGVARARQAGFERAHGQIIASTDADTHLPPDWLQKIYDALSQNPQAIGVSGKVRFYGSKSIKTGFYNLISSVLSRITVWMTSDRGFFRGANFAIRQDIFKKIGGFDKSIICGEDQELGLRAAKFGKIIYRRDLVVATSARRYQTATPRDLLRFYLINFISLHIWGKPYVETFNEIRTGHDSKVSVNLLKAISTAIGIVIIIGVLVAVTVYGAFNPRSQLMGKTYWRDKTRQKVIALTFDDGPDEPYTSQVISILDKNHIKATFFEVGQNVEYYPQTTKKIFIEGHIIGNHSYSHSADMALTTDKNLVEQIGQTNDAIAKVIGKKPKLFRPPYGIKSPLLLQYLKKNNMATIEWSDMTKDYENPGVGKIVEGIMKKAKPGGILVLHDGNTTRHGADRSQTVSAIPIIIEKLKAQGYEFVTVPELLGLEGYQ